MSATPHLSRREWTAGALAAFWIPAHGSAAALDPGVLLTGSPASPAAPIALRAGPVTAVFEPGIAFLRYVKYGEHEILRGLYAAVRDKVWGTVAPRVSNVVAEQRADSFRLTFDVDNVEGDIDFGWKGIITGDPAGTVRFEFNGRARSAFLKNRLGFAVLHPIRECAGKPCTVEKSGGVKEPGTFPDVISPHQPFLDLRAISHQVEPGIEAEVRFEGEVFEMEDHRNWTDGNYKTYCTPLAKPFPVEVRRGEEVRQAVTISLRGAPPAQAKAASPARRPLRIEVPAEAKTTRLPAIGLGLAAAQPTLTAQESARLKLLHPAHLRVDLRLGQPDWESAWKRAVTEAAAIGARLEAAVFLTPASGEAELRTLISRVNRERVVRWLVFDRDAKVAPEPLAVAARKLLGPAAPVVIGTNEYFTELNRERPAAAALDASCYSINPQVHAFDNQSLVENLEPQGETVRSALRFLGGKPVCVSPVSFKPRFNPQAKGAPEPVVPGRLPSKIDPRQMSLFGAAWTLGSIKYLAEAGASSITYFETHGWGGVLESAQGPAMPDLFPSIPGAVFPLFHVLADAGEFAGGAVRTCSSSHPLETCALALESGARKRLMVANLTREPRVVEVNAAAWLGPRARLAVLDEQNAEEAMRSPEKIRTDWARGAGIEALSGVVYRLALLPYSIARLDKV